MHRLGSLILLLMLLPVLPAAAQDISADAPPSVAQAGPDPADVTSWPGASVDRFGCMLEQDFGGQSQRFGCAVKNYVNRGNPCSAPEAYYEGPQLPGDLATRISPLLQSIDVKYEAGRVQSVTLFFAARHTDSAIRAAFGLPSADAKLPANLIALDIDGCRPDGPTQICNIVLMEGFRHRGAGDGACGEDMPPDPTTDDEGSGRSGADTGAGTGTPTK